METVSDRAGRQRRLLVISGDAIGAEMAGGAIRALELARVLHGHADVTLAAPEPSNDAGGPVPVIDYSPRDPRSLRAHIAAADVILAKPQWPLLGGWLERSAAQVVYDLYDPEPFEVAEYLAGRRVLRPLLHTLTVDRILSAMRSGHFFVCASSKQRDLWIGAMLAAGLLTPSVYDSDPGLRSVIDEVPFGLTAEPPSRAGPGPRELFPGLGPDAEIVLWNGGIWGWLDAPTAVRAIGLLAERRPDVRLVFMGAAEGPASRSATLEVRQVALELGLLDRHVFFNERWVPYEQRSSWLLDADCAISTHSEHLETNFAFRTRLLDCFWAGLPVVCTYGDQLADRVQRDDLGRAVAPGDPAAVAAGIEAVLQRGRPRYADSLARVAAEHLWDRVARPLVARVIEPVPSSSASPLASGARLPFARRARTAALGAVLAVNARSLKRWPQL